jgi:hypothetical protein
MDSIYEEKIKKELDDILERVHNSGFYKDLTPQQLQYLAVKLAEFVRKAYLSWFLPEFKGDPTYPNLCYHHKDMLKTVEQVWKRKVYFKVFHKGVTDMNELKEASLYCFWVLKLCPFFRLTGSVSTTKFNAAIALYILFNGLSAFVADMNKKEANALSKDPKHQVRHYRCNLSLNALSNLHYSFQFRDWSKEAIMDLAESLVDVK